VKHELKSTSLFTSESHLWRLAYSLDPTVLRAIEKEEREMTNLQHITERRIGGDICFFGDDPKIRPFQYDIALSSLIQMKDYVDSMQIPTQLSLRQLCHDWATTKLSSLVDAQTRGEKIEGLTSQLRELEELSQERERKMGKMEGDMKRVNEFKDRIVELTHKDNEWKKKARATDEERARLVNDFEEIQVTPSVSLCLSLSLPLSLCLSLRWLGIVSRGGGRAQAHHREDPHPRAATGVPHQLLRLL
jgi:hypothetical protein